MTKITINALEFIERQLGLCNELCRDVKSDVQDFSMNSIMDGMSEKSCAGRLKAAMDKIIEARGLIREINQIKKD